MKGKKTGGRVAGTPNKATIDKEQHLDVLRQLILRESGSMTQAQVDSAKGVKRFFLKDKRGKFVQILDPTQIEVALNSGQEGSYYWIHTQNPSTAAYTDLMNRTFGKPPERVEHTGKDGEPIVIEIRKPWADDA